MTEENDKPEKTNAFPYIKPRYALVKKGIADEPSIIRTILFYVFMVALAVIPSVATIMLIIGGALK